MLKKLKTQLTKLVREVFYLERINSMRCNYRGMDTTQTIIENKNDKEK